MVGGVAKTGETPCSPILGDAWTTSPEKYSRGVFVTGAPIREFVIIRGWLANKQAREGVRSDRSQARMVGDLSLFRKQGV